MPCEPLDQSCSYLFAQIARAQRALAYAAFAKIGLHPGQELVLHALWCEEGQTAGELAERVGVQPPTVTKMLRHLEASGFVERCRCPHDGRAVRVYLGRRGHAARVEVESVWARIERTSLAGLTADEAALLKHLLNRIRSRL